MSYSTRPEASVTSTREMPVSSTSVIAPATFSSLSSSRPESAVTITETLPCSELCLERNVRFSDVMSGYVFSRISTARMMAI